MSIADVSPIAMFPDRLPGNLWNFDMTKSNVAALFDCLDAWRNLPAYQLERRADIFFGLFLPLALDHYLKPRDISVDPHIIPEFPLGQSDTNRSDKADFFAVSRDRERAFLIELKTDMGSLRDSQEDYLNRAVARGLDAVTTRTRHNPVIGMRGVVGQAHAAVIQEAGEAVSALEHVVDRSGRRGLSREPGVVALYPGFELGNRWCARLGARGGPSFSGLSVDRALDAYQCVDRPRRESVDSVLQPIDRTGHEGTDRDGNGEEPVSSPPHAT